MEDIKKTDVIDLRIVARKIYKRRKTFFITWFVVFVISCAIILCVPRYYVTNVKLAPEMGGTSAGGVLSIASSFGFDLGSMETTDAISPLIYPDLFESNDFVVSLFDIKVENIDGDIKTDYYTYMTQYQKKTLFKIPFIWLRKQIKSLFKEKKNMSFSEDGSYVNPFMMSEEQEMLVEGVKSKITCGVDKKTVMITITVEDQDPLVCAIMADSVSARLQQFITEYRTSKARVDYEYYKALAQDAKLEYETALQRYSEYTDKYRNAVIQIYVSERDKLENDMQMKYNTYTAMNTQLETAKAKVQERTPAFTMIQGPSVPNKPEGPKRMLFVIGMLFVSTIFVVAYIMKDDIMSQLKLK